MDWEYPGVRVGHRVEDRENFATLLKVLYKLLNLKMIILILKAIDLLTGNAG